MIPRALALLALLQFGERIEVRLQQVDVIVERRDGTPVTDLRLEDFEVRQDGVLQTITNFSLITESTAADQMAPDPAAPQSEPTVRPRPPRKFVFFVDEFPMHEQTRKEILGQANELVEGMIGNDEAMVITPAAMEQIPLLFTRDKNAIMTTLDNATRLMMRKEDVVNLDRLDLEFEHELVKGDGMLRRGDCSASLYECAKRRLESLRAITGAMGQVPGKKVLLLLSSQMSSVPGLQLRIPTVSNPSDPRGSSSIIGGHFRDLQRLTGEVARAAAANNVVVYGIETYDPVRGALPGMSVDTPRPGLRPIAQRGAAGAQDLLISLAEATGGRSYSGTMESGKMFEQLSGDLRSYYSLAFRAGEPRRGSTRRVEVRVKNRPDLIVRARRNVTVVDDKQEIGDRTLSALLTSEPPNTLGIGVRARQPIRHGREREMPLEIRIPIRKLTFVQEAKGYRGKFMVHVATVGTHADFGSNNVEHTQDLLIPLEKWEKSQQEHYTFNVSVRLKPGRYRFAVGVTDVASRESGFQAFPVIAP